MEGILYWAVFVPLRCEGAFSRPVTCLSYSYTDVVSVGVGGRGLVRAGHATMSIVRCPSDYVPTDVQRRTNVTNWTYRCRCHYVPSNVQRRTNVANWIFCCRCHYVPTNVQTRTLMLKSESYTGCLFCFGCFVFLSQIRVRLYRVFPLVFFETCCPAPLCKRMEGAGQKFAGGWIDDTGIATRRRCV